MAMVGVDGSSLQVESVGLVCWSATTCRCSHSTIHIVFDGDWLVS